MRVGEQLFVCAQPVGKGIRKEHTAERHHQSKNDTTDGREREGKRSAVVFVLTQFYPNEHSRSAGKEQAHGEHKLHNGFGKVDSTHAILANEVTDDDSINDITQTTREGYQDRR